VKLSLKGFPHSSQDTETITCAETSIWACVEYFGHQYPEYNPVLPSDIIDVLSKSAFERQLPSHGLDAIQISSTLKKFGFGNKIYFKDIFKDKFMSLLNTYIESGLPVIIGLNKLDQLSNTWKYDTPGHAVIFIGREELTDKHINGCFSIETVDKISIRDLSAMNHEYVIIDDNYPPYQLAEYNNPCKYSNDKRYDGLQIAYFIVPLHPKIYLEAFEAKRFLIELLTISKAKLPDNSLTAIRFYLTSSRSYKDWLIRESDMDMKMKKIIVNTSMAKFLWVAELGSSDSFKQKKATGLVLLDATSANTDNCKPLLLSVHNNQLVSFNLNTNKLMRAKLSLAPFNIYQGNLKSVIS
jgi:hypothetical protein